MLFSLVMIDSKNTHRPAPYTSRIVPSDRHVAGLGPNNSARHVDELNPRANKSFPCDKRAAHSVARGVRGDRGAVRVGEWPAGAAVRV